MRVPVYYEITSITSITRNRFFLSNLDDEHHTVPTFKSYNNNKLLTKFCVVTKFCGFFKNRAWKHYIAHVSHFSSNFQEDLEKTCDFQQKLTLCFELPQN